MVKIWRTNKIWHLGLLLNRTFRNLGTKIGYPPLVPLAWFDLTETSQSRPTEPVSGCLLPNSLFVSTVVVSRRPIPLSRYDELGGS